MQINNIIALSAVVIKAASAQNLANAAASNLLIENPRTTCTSDDPSTTDQTQLQFVSCPPGYNCITCKATLITDEWAVTAATCVNWYVAGMNLDDSRLTDFSQNKYVLAQDTPIIMHEDFNQNQMENDIALLKVAGIDGKLPKACLTNNCMGDVPPGFANFYDCNIEQFYGMLDGTSICAFRAKLEPSTNYIASNTETSSFIPGTPLLDDQGNIRALFGWASEMQYQRQQPLISLTRITSHLSWISDKLLEAGVHRVNGDSLGWLNNTSNREKCLEGAGPTASGLSRQGTGLMDSTSSVEVKALTGEIQTPNYPRNYPNNYKYTWMWKADHYKQNAHCYNVKEWAKIHFHFSDMNLEGQAVKPNENKKQVCYDKIKFEYRNVHAINHSPDDDVESKVVEAMYCGDIDQFTVLIPSTELNITFTSDYSMAKKGFFAKYTVEYVEDCYQDKGAIPDYDYNQADYLARFPSSARLSKNELGADSGDKKEEKEDLGLQQGRHPHDDNRAAQPQKEMSNGIKILIGVLSAVGMIVGLATLMQVYQYNRIKVITTTQGEHGMGDAPLDSERGGYGSSKHAMSLDGFTREDVEMIAEHVISAISIRNRSHSSIRSSPNKTLNESYQITTQYLDPKADKFKKLGKKNAIHDIHDMQEITPVQSPLCKKAAIHDIHDSDVSLGSRRQLVRKPHYHDIHSESKQYDESGEMIKEHLRLKPMHSSPNLASPRRSSTSLPMQMLLKKQKHKHQFQDSDLSANFNDTITLKKLESVEENDNYVVQLKASKARMSIHDIQEADTGIRYPYTNTDEVETRSIPKRTPDSEVVVLRHAAEKFSLSEHHTVKASKEETRVVKDPFVVRKADAKTSVSICDNSASTTGPEEPNNHSTFVFTDHNNSTFRENISSDSSQDNSKISTPVKMTTVYRQVEQNPTNQSNEVDDIINNLT